MSKLLSLGFIFDQDLEQVLLVHKNRPAWQAGLINGVGGKVEPDETPLQCMVRECTEETTLEIQADAWQHTATIHDDGGQNPGATIEIYAAAYDGPTTDAVKNDHEEIEWFPIGELPDNVIDNLHFLVPLARQKLLGHPTRIVHVHY